MRRRGRTLKDDRNLQWPQTVRGACRPGACCDESAVAGSGLHLVNLTSRDFGLCGREVQLSRKRALEGTTGDESGEGEGNGRRRQRYCTMVLHFRRLSTAAYSTDRSVKTIVQRMRDTSFAVGRKEKRRAISKNASDQEPRSETNGDRVSFPIQQSRNAASEYYKACRRDGGTG